MGMKFLLSQIEPLLASGSLSRETLHQSIAAAKSFPIQDFIIPVTDRSIDFGFVESISRNGQVERVGRNR